jgi:hypothetical protein
MLLWEIRKVEKGDRGLDKTYNNKNIGAEEGCEW